MTNSDYKGISRRRRAARDEILHKTSALLSSKPSVSVDTLNEYTMAPASVIVENIRAGKWKAVTVMEAYIRRALETHDAVNCFTEGKC